MDQYKTYLLDYEASLQLHESIKDRIEPKACYNNIFIAVTRNISKLAFGEWNVAYGYMSAAVNGIYVRHCYIVTEDKRIIDPTLPFSFRKEKYPEYLTFVILDYEEYKNKLEENDLVPDLKRSLMPIERQIWKESFEHGIALIS